VSETVHVVEPVERAGPPPRPAGRRNALSLLRDALLRRREASVLIVALALMAYFQFTKSIFLTHDNLRNIAQATAPNAIVATGIVLLLVSGEIDLSVGMTFALAPFLMHYFADFYHVPAIAAILLALIVAAGIGWFNGFISIVLRVPSFVATLGTFYALQGFLLTTSHAYPAEIPQDMDGAIRQWIGPPSGWAEVIWAVAIVVVFHVVVTWTRWGLHTVSVGGNLLGRGRRETGDRVTDGIPLNGHHSRGSPPSRRTCWSSAAGSPGRALPATRRCADSARCWWSSTIWAGAPARAPAAWCTAACATWRPATSA